MSRSLILSFTTDLPFVVCDIVEVVGNSFVERSEAVFSVAMRQSRRKMFLVEMEYSGFNRTVCSKVKRSLKKIGVPRVSVYERCLGRSYLDWILSLSRLKDVGTFSHVEFFRGVSHVVKSNGLCRARDCHLFVSSVQLSRRREFVDDED